MPKKNAPDPAHPDPGALHIDASDVEVVDLLPDQINKLTKLRDGYTPAVQALTSLTAAELTTLGIHTDHAQKAGKLAGDLDRLKELRPATKKLDELMDETEKYRGHELGGILSEAAAQAKRRAEREPEARALLAKIQAVLDYTSGPAMKAVATKEKAKAKAKSGKDK